MTIKDKLRNEYIRVALIDQNNISKKAYKKELLNLLELMTFFGDEFTIELTEEISIYISDLVEPNAFNKFINKLNKYNRS